MNRETFLQSFGYIAEAPGGIDKLRFMILNLAMRGRLTRRQVADEPATALLHRAREAKAALVADGRIRKPKAYGPVEPGDEPYPIPPGWAWCRTVDLIHTVNGRAFKPTEWSNSGLPIIRIQNLNNAAAPFNYFSGSVDEQHLVQPGDLLISWSGTPGTSFGSFIWDGPAGVLNQHIFKCRLFEDCRDFICLAINSRLDVLIEDAHGGVGLQHFTKDKLERLPLAIPPLQEQQRIVQRVSELMDLCDELGQQQEAGAEMRSALTASTLSRITEACSVDLRTSLRAFADNIDVHLAPGEGDLAALSRVRQGIIDLAVQGRLTHQDSEEEPAAALLEVIAAARARNAEARPRRTSLSQSAITTESPDYELPPGWTRSSLGELALSSDSGWSPSCLPTVRTDDSQWAVLKVSAVTWGSFRSQEHKLLGPDLEPRPAIEVHDGDFLMSRANTSELVGRSVVVREPPPRLMLSDKIVRLKFADQATAEYVNLVNASSATRAYYASVSSGTSASMRNITRGQILSLAVPLPPLAEQARIVRRVAELCALCDNLETQLAAARVLRGDVAASVAAHVVSGISTPYEGADVPQVPSVGTLTR